MSRTIFIGDVHGCIDELKEMIHRLSLQDSDRVILLGDLINRGPDPVSVVKYVYEQKFECLMGNHEYEYLQEYNSNPIYQKLHQKLGNTLHRWIENLPFWIEGENFIAVHAGLQPYTTLEKTPKHVLVFIRTWGGESITSQEGTPWFTLYQGKKIVIYGHWARRGLTIRDSTIGLDSGCVYGKFLSAYILEEKRIIQIPARRRYYIPPSLRGK